MKMKKLVPSAWCLVLSAKKILTVALCAVGLSAFAEEPDAVQLWENGPYWATSNVGTPETHDPAYPAEYGALYKFDDAGTAVKSLLGEEWRVPTQEELQKLDGEIPGFCTKTWDSTKKGYTFTGATEGYKDKSIFLPAAGFGYGNGRLGAGGEGYYWSSTGKDASSACRLIFYEGNAAVNSSDRSNGLSVRAVKDPPPPPEPVPYLDWDDAQKKMTNAVCKVFEVVTNEMATFEAGKTYVVKGNVTNTTAGIVVEGTAANPTRLILCDGAELVAQKGVLVQAKDATTNALTICGQTLGTGTLEATGAEHAAGIGGGEYIAGGIVTINGGTVLAIGDDNAAGIGGGNGYNTQTYIPFNTHGGMVTINGGTVTATGGDYAAGIGGGSYGNGGTVTINGGTVTATGGDYAAGIGGGFNGDGGTMAINGGIVTAIAGMQDEDGPTAAIGGGQEATDQGTVTFGAEFYVVTGETAAVTAPIAQEDYEKDHSARYVHIAPPEPEGISAESDEFAIDLRTHVDLAEGETTVSNVTWSATQWGEVSETFTTVGWTNLLTGATGVFGNLSNIMGEGAKDADLPKVDGDYVLTHSTGDLKSFVTFTVSGYPAGSSPENPWYVGTPDKDDATAWVDNALTNVAPIVADIGLPDATNALDLVALTNGMARWYAPADTNALVLTGSGTGMLPAKWLAQNGIAYNTLAEALAAGSTTVTPVFDEPPKMLVEEVEVEVEGVKKIVTATMKNNTDGAVDKSIQAVGVEGLADFAESIKTNVVLDVTAKDNVASSTRLNEAAVAAMGGRSTKSTTSHYAEITLTAIAEDGKETPLPGLPEPLAIRIPWTFEAHHDYKVVREHKGATKVFPETADADGEYVEFDKANGLITVHSAFFSDYAVVDFALATVQVKVPAAGSLPVGVDSITVKANGQPVTPTPAPVGSNVSTYEIPVGVTVEVVATAKPGYGFGAGGTSTKTLVPRGTVPGDDITVTLAEIDDIRRMATGPAAVYEWKFTGKTAKGVVIKGTKDRTVSGGCADDGTIHGRPDAVIRVPGTVAIRAYSYICDDACQTWGTSLLLPSKSQYFATKPWKSQVAAYRGQRFITEINAAEVVGKTGKQYELGGAAKFVFDHPSDLAETFELTFAGFGSYDVRNGRASSVSGKFAGLQSVPRYMGTVSGLPKCPAADYWDCRSLTYAGDSYHASVVYGTWSVRYNASASKRLEANGNYWVK